MANQYKKRKEVTTSYICERFNILYNDYQCQPSDLHLASVYIFLHPIFHFSVSPENDKMQSVEETSKGTTSEAVAGAQSDVLSSDVTEHLASGVDELGRPQQDSHLPFSKPPADEKRGNVLSVTMTTP
jgi:hypothetical protein